MRILIADDDPTSRMLLAAFLKGQQYEVLVTCDGAEAWAAMQRPDCPKLMILDRMMPHLDGLALCRRARELPTTPPPYIILLATRGDKEDIITGLQAGANDYVAKPFHPAELCARLEVGKRLLEAQEQVAMRVTELQTALAQIKTLRGMIPICACCKKVRNERDYWEQVEQYVSQHTDAQFTHGLCPECLPKYYPPELLEADVIKA